MIRPVGRLVSFINDFEFHSSYLEAHKAGLADWSLCLGCFVVGFITSFPLSGDDNFVASYSWKHKLSNWSLRVEVSTVILKFCLKKKEEIMELISYERRVYESVDDQSIF